MDFLKFSFILKTRRKYFCIQYPRIDQSATQRGVKFSPKISPKQQKRGKDKRLGRKIKTGSSKMLSKSFIFYVLKHINGFGNL